MATKVGYFAILYNEKGNFNLSLVEGVGSDDINFFQFQGRELRLFIENKVYFSMKSHSTFFVRSNTVYNDKFELANKILITKVMFNYEV